MTTMTVTSAVVGEFLNAGAPVATLVRIHPLRLRLAVPEREAAAIRQGQRVRADQTRSLMIEAEIPNPQGRLRPGAFARGEIVVQPDRRLVTVPAEALVTFAGIEKVLVVEGGRPVGPAARTGRARPALRRSLFDSPPRFP
jgi:multidrug efflux pump subunit AcrA (membrane-fusion protein)